MMKHDLTNRHLPKASKKGFTLVELMIAVAIIGVGMSLIAASFPAGMSSFRTATQLSRGSSICRNAFALAIADGKNTAARFKSTKFTSSFYSYAHPFSPMLPSEDKPKAEGSIIIGRQYSSFLPGVETGQYHLIAIAVRYDSQPGSSPTSPSSAVSVQEFKIKNSTPISMGNLSYTRLTLEDESKQKPAPIGSPIINTETGAIAMIKGYDVSNDTIILDRLFKIANGGSALVVMPTTATSGSKTCVSPAFYATSTITGLKK